MPVLVVAAMGSEMRAFDRRRRRAQATPDRPDVVTAILGIGTRRARASTERLLAGSSPDHVLVIGVAGGVGPTVGIGDLVVPEVVLDAATGEEHRPSAVDGFTPRGVLHTSDELVVDPAAVGQLAARGVVALDMETAAVAAVCEDRGVPWSVLRGISDHTETQPVDPAILGLMGADGQPRAAAVARYVLARPSRVVGLSRLARGLGAATTASADAALAALAVVGAS